MTTRTLEDVKRECASRARAHRSHRNGSFPKLLRLGMTTADYIGLYAIGRNVLPIANLSHHASHCFPSLTPEQDKVIVEHDDDEVTYA
jgi:hypothetical protein